MTSPAPVRLPIAGAVQLTMRLTQQGQPAAVVLGYFGGPANPGLVTSQSILNAAWYKLVRPLTTSDVTCTGGVMRSVDGSEISVELAAPSGGTTVAAAGVSNIAAACSVIKWSSAGPGRSGKGRTFIPLPGPATQDARAFTSTWTTTANNAAAAYLADPAFGGGGGFHKPAILSFKRGAAYVITAGALSPVVGIQRRRMR